MSTDTEWDSLHCTCGNGAVQAHEPHCSVTIIRELEAALRGFLAAGDYSSQHDVHDFDAMVRFGEAATKARAALAKLEG